MANDLIYREDAKVFVRHACYKKINPIDYLDEVPAADVRPVVHGEWQEIPGLADVPIKVYACSLCHRVIKIPCSLCVQEIAPFCHCGADMREVNNG